MDPVIFVDALCSFNSSVKVHLHTNVNAISVRYIIMLLKTEGLLLILTIFYRRSKFEICNSLVATAEQPGMTSCPGHDRL